MSTQSENIVELNVNYNCLGEDLILLESVLQAIQEENNFPTECVSSALTRVNDYIQQHTKAINQMSQYLTTSYLTTSSTAS